MMVVPVLITNCHVFEYLNMGPVNAQIMITIHALITDPGLPAVLVIKEENISK